MGSSEGQRLIVHLHILATDEHFYFGSVAAMYQQFTSAEIGVAMQTLYNKWRNENVYSTDKVVLRKGRLIQKQKSKQT